MTVRKTALAEETGEDDPVYAHVHGRVHHVLLPIHGGVITTLMLLEKLGELFSWF